MTKRQKQPAQNIVHSKQADDTSGACSVSNHIRRSKDLTVPLWYSATRVNYFSLRHVFEVTSTPELAVV